MKIRLKKTQTKKQVRSNLKLLNNEKMCEELAKTLNKMIIRLITRYNSKKTFNIGKQESQGSRGKK